MPHIYGETDEAAAFGFAYAQAEDNFAIVEDNFIDAIGRSSEVGGETGVLDDWLNRALQIVELSKNNMEKPFSSSHVNQMLSSLSTVGLIYKNRFGKYSFAVPLLGQFIIRQQKI